MKKHYILYLLLALSIKSYSQDGTWDPTFNIGTGVQGQVRAIKTQSDGKILIGGYFPTYNSNPVNNIARLNADGIYDSTFIQAYSGQSEFDVVMDIYVDEDDKLLVSSYERVLTRLNSDGSIDTTFNLDYPIQGIYHVDRQGDKYIISGAFYVEAEDGHSYHQVARINYDGSLDTSFQNTFLPNFVDSVSGAFVVEDSKILVTGDFSKFNNISANSVVKLNPDGSIDTTFDPGTGANGSINTAFVQQDGKYIITGSFNTINGVFKIFTARLNINGSLDETFTPAPGYELIGLCVIGQSDNKILVGGAPNGNNPGIRLVRLLPTGAVDTSFITSGWFNDHVRSIALQEDNKLLAGGDFTHFNDTPRAGVARLNNTVLSVKEYQMAGLSVYPNPVNDKLTIDTGSFSLATANVTVYDITGKVVYVAEQVTAGNIQLDMAAYNSGLYLVTVSAGNKTLTHKIIKN